MKIIFAIAIFATTAFAGVGFQTKTITKADRSIELFIWYPAKAKTEKLTFGDYVSLLREQNREEWLATAVTGDPKGIDEQTIRKILNHRMTAVRGANPKKGRFPLVLWTMRHETVVAQSMLNEYLAEHGYVVAVARYAGEPLPFPWVIKTPEKKREVFKRHLADMEIALDVLSFEKNVDASSVAIMNWSYAAELSPLMQTRHSNIKMVIGLSSNPLSPNGLYQGKDAELNLVPEKLDVPYVIMSERIGTDGKLRKPPAALMNKMPTESRYLQFTGLAHGNFNMVEGYIPGNFGVKKLQPWSVGGKAAIVGYKEIMRHTVINLDFYIRQGLPPWPRTAGYTKEISLKTTIFNHSNK